MRKYLPYIVGGVILYLFWEKLKALGNAAGNAVPQSWIDYVANPGGPVNVTAQILLPDSRVINASLVYLNSDMRFSYAGRTYQLTGRNAQNYYVAVPV